MPLTRIHHERTIFPGKHVRVSIVVWVAIAVGTVPVLVTGQFFVASPHAPTPIALVAAVGEPNPCVRFDLICEQGVSRCRVHLYSKIKIGKVCIILLC